MLFKPKPEDRGTWEIFNRHIPKNCIKCNTESKNGVVSNNVKDIGIIPQFGNTENSNSNTQLHFESAYENRINLNNLQTININQIDCLVTYDDNTQARVLENTSTFIVKFHLGKED